MVLFFNIIELVVLMVISGVILFGIPIFIVPIIVIALIFWIPFRGLASQKTIKYVIQQAKTIDSVEKYEKYLRKYRYIFTDCGVWSVYGGMVRRKGLQIYGAISTDELIVASDMFEELNDGCGVESIESEYQDDRYWGKAIGLYVNTGDTYNLTIVYNIIDQHFEFVSWGDFFESKEIQLQLEHGMM